MNFGKKNKKIHIRYYVKKYLGKNTFQYSKNISSYKILLKFFSFSLKTVIQNLKIQ